MIIPGISQLKAAVDKAQIKAMQIFAPGEGLSAQRRVKTFGTESKVIAGTAIVLGGTAAIAAGPGPAAAVARQVIVGGAKFVSQNPGKVLAAGIASEVMLSNPKAGKEVVETTKDFFGEVQQVSSGQKTVKEGLIDFATQNPIAASAIGLTGVFVGGRAVGNLVQAGVDAVLNNDGDLKEEIEDDLEKARKAAEKETEKQRKRLEKETAAMLKAEEKARKEAEKALGSTAITPTPAPTPKPQDKPQDTPASTVPMTPETAQIQEVKSGTTRRKRRRTVRKPTQNIRVNVLNANQSSLNYAKKYLSY